MKTINDLFNLVAEATSQNSADHRTWFFNFSGHVNTMNISFWHTGWNADYPTSEQKIEQHLTEEGIQTLYWFIKTRL